VLLGALIAAEKLIIQPINILATMAKRFGQGDWSARPARNRLPAEFVPLARAFNSMASELSQRERDLVATNDRLTNHRIGIAAKGKGVFANIADSAEECHFIVPARVQRGSVQVAISTGGENPRLSAELRKKLEEVL